jgi:UDP-N-acetylmuramyl pentapeptide synthase
MTHTHTWHFESRDEAYECLNEITTGNVEDLVNVNQEGDTLLIAKYNGGRFEMIVSVDTVDTISGSCQDANTAWFVTHGEMLEVTLGEITEHDDVSPLAGLFQSWGKIFGGRA